MEVSIFSCLVLWPDILLLRTLPACEAGGFCVGRTLSVRIASKWSPSSLRRGRFAFAFAAERLESAASATVDRDVIAVVRLEETELCHVFPEYPLESDVRGRADFDWRPKSKPKSLDISSRRRSPLLRRQTTHRDLYSVHLLPFEAHGFVNEQLG